MLEVERVLTLEEKIEILKSAAYVSSIDDDYFVVRSEDTFCAIVCETFYDQNMRNCHRVILATPFDNLDEAVISVISSMTIDNGADESFKEGVVRIAERFNSRLRHQ